MNKHLQFLLPLSRRLKQSALLLMMFVCMGTYKVLAQTTEVVYNFEDNTTENWQVSTATYATFSVNSTSTYVRTGSYSMHIAVTAATTATAPYFSPSGGLIYNGTTSSTGQYVITPASSSYVFFICWLYASTITPSTTTEYWAPSYFATSASNYSSTTLGTLRSSSTTSEAYASTSTGTWLQFFSLSTSTNSSKADNAALIKAGKTTNDVWMDDGILYATSQSSPDLVAPNAPTSLSGSLSGNTVNLSWTSNTDVSTGSNTFNGVSISNASAYTGVQNTIVLRTTNTSASAPVLNNQGIYTVSGGIGGPHTDPTGNWTIISTTTGATATSYSDVAVANGTYKYAVILRDMAYNYSAAAVSSSITISVSSPPTLTAASSATVDNSFNITFTDNSAWRSAITTVKYGSNTLTLNTDYTISAGTLTLIPSGSTGSGLRTPGTNTVTVSATGYTDATVSQTVGIGAASQLVITTQPTAPATDGGSLVAQPVVKIEDQYGNIETGSSASVTAAASGTTYTLGGTTSVNASSGVVTYSGLTAYQAGGATGATITFSSSGLTSATSGSFNIPAATAPTLTAAAGATVDASFNVTFTDDATWRSNITTVKYGSNTLTLNTDYTISSGTLTLIPSGSSSSGLRTAGTATVTVSATGYADATVSQTIGAGAASQLGITTQPTAPNTNGGTLNTQPVVKVEDQYSNVVTTGTYSVTAAASGATYSLGGTVTLTPTSGVATYSGLTATASGAVTGATITFSATGLTSATSNSFNLSAPGTTVNYYYYTGGTLDPNTLSNWTTDATGATQVGAPANFLDPNQVFNISPITTTLTIGSTCSCGWTVSGSGSKVVVTTADLNGNGHSYSGPIDIGANRTVTFTSTGAKPVFGAIGTGSTVSFTTQPTGGYFECGANPFYNFTTTQSLTDTNTVNTFAVTNTLSISAGKTITLNANAGMSIGGTVNNNSTGLIDGQTNAGTTITFNGTSAQTVPAGLFTSSKLDNLVIDNSAGVTFTTTAYTVKNSLTLKSGALTATGLTEGVAATTSTVYADGGSLTNAPTYAGTVNVVANPGTGITINSGNELTPASGSVTGLTASSGTYTLTTAPTLTSLTVSSGATIDAAANSITLSATGATISGTYKHDNANGFSGGTSTSIKSTNAPTITLNPGSTVVYYGSGTPTISTGTYQNLSVTASGASLAGNTTVDGTLSLSAPLTVGSNSLTVNDFSGSSTNALNVTSGSTVVISGSLSNPLYFVSGNNTLGTFTVNGSVTLGNTLNMASGSTPGTVTVGTGATLTTGGNLYLLSDANGTARIGEVDGTVSGNVNIQRYVPAQRGYRLIGHPYTGNSVTIATLGQYFDITGITGGNIGPSSTHCPSTTPSTYTYTPGTSPSYTGITSTSTVVPAAQSSSSAANGILAFVRGGTGDVGCVAGQSYTVTPTTIQTDGPINQGNITETIPAGGYNLISNPYPSQIQISGIGNYNASGVSFIIVNPGTQNGGNNYVNGTAYATASGSTIIPINGAVIAYNASASDVTLTFSESSTKSSGTPTSGLLKETNVYPTLDLSVYNNNSFWDSWSLMLQPGTSNNSGDIGDITKISNTNFDIYSLSHNGKSMYRDARDADSITDGDVIALGLRSVAQSSYTIQVSNDDIPSDKTVYLHDKYTNTYVLLSNGVTYPFTITSDTASQGHNRMELVFNENNSNSGIGIVANHTGVTVVPNPATSNINVSYTNAYAGTKTIDIINIVGVVVKEVNTAEQSINISVDNLSSGMYMIRTTVNGQSVTERFIKN